MSILRKLNQKLAQDALKKQVKARSYDFDEESSDEEFERRGALQDLKNILDHGKIFLDKLPTETVKEYEKLYKKFAKASFESKKHYFELVIKYAKKCAAGVDFGKSSVKPPG